MQTVVVLPFEQPQGELELVADGLVDEITAQLARLQTLNVVARTSAFTFRGSELDIPAIAEKLQWWITPHVQSRCEYRRLPLR